MTEQEKQQLRCDTRKNIHWAISKGYETKYPTWDTDEKLLEEAILIVSFMMRDIDISKLKGE